MEEYYRYIESNGRFYKYVEAGSREDALHKLSFLVDDSGYADCVYDTWLELKKFEKIEYSEIPDGANILYRAEKNRIRISGTSEGPIYVKGTNIGWTKSIRKPMLYLFYVLPFKVFVVANSEEAAYSKLFPIQSTIKRVEKIRKRPPTINEIYMGKKNNQIYEIVVSIYPCMEAEKSYNRSDFEGFLPENVTMITEPTLDYDRWGNFITGYLFRRTHHQERFSEQQFNVAIKNGLLSTYDLICDEIPDSEILCEYQSQNKIIFEALYPSENVCKTRPLPVFLESKKSDIKFVDDQGTIRAILTSTGEYLEVEECTADIIRAGDIGELTDYEVYDMKKGYKYIQVIQLIDLEIPF